MNPYFNELQATKSELAAADKLIANLKYEIATLKSGAEPKTDLACLDFTIPSEVLEAALKIDMWAKKQGFSNYKLGPIQSRI